MTIFDTQKDWSKKSWKEINSKEWSWNNINNSINNDNRKLAVLKGVVLDMKNTHSSWTNKNVGRDFTTLMGCRWAGANNVNTKSIDMFEKKQKKYINHIMGSTINNSPTGFMRYSIVGKLNKNEKYGFDNYNW